MKPLQENPQHVLSKTLFAKELVRLDYKVEQEYPFVMVGMFGYHPEMVWKEMRDIRFLRGQRYIEKMKDLMMYPHSIDIFAEKLLANGIRVKIAIEIDGESHDNPQQKKNDELFEVVFWHFFEDPKEFFRVKKSHVLQAAHANVLSYLVDWVLKGKYQRLMEKDELDIQALISLWQRGIS